MKDVPCRARLILMTACAMLLAACSAGSPESTVQAFYKHLANSNSDAAIALVDFHDVQGDKQAMAKAKVKLALVAIKAKIDAAGGLDSVDVTSLEHSDDNHAKAQVSLHFKNGEVHKTRLKLIRVDDGWRIALL